MGGKSYLAHGRHAASRWMLGFRWHKLHVDDVAEVSRMGICFRRAGDLQRIRSGRSSDSENI